MKWLAATAVFLTLVGVCSFAQSNEPKQQPSPAQSGPREKDKGSSNTPDAPATGSAAQRFPYPGEEHPAAPAVPDGPAAAPDGSTGTTDAPKSFPYPGDPDAASSSSSSSSSSSGTGEGTDIPPEAPARRKLPREFHPQSPEDRVTEDLDVARFYRNQGDLRAAYLRAQDAVKTLPNDPEGHFLLGTIAQEMKNRDQAVAELKNYLRLEPDGDHVKEAHRRLAQMH